MDNGSSDPNEEVSPVQALPPLTHVIQIWIQLCCVLYLGYFMVMIKVKSGMNTYRDSSEESVE